MKIIRFIGLLIAIFASSIFASSIGCANRPVHVPVMERVEFIPSIRDSSIRYETTFFIPQLDGGDTAPIVIINHGTNPGGNQGRYRASSPSKFFTGHGCTVILPMRRGYSQSTGERTRIRHCNLTEYGIESAKDIQDIVLWLKQQSEYRNRTIIMIGQSTGGLTTMAYSSLSKDPVDAIINFHGGVRPNSPDDCKWQARIEAFETYAQTSSPSSLWFYTSNDHSSNPEYISRLYSSFTKAGGIAKLVQLPAFKSDGHYLFDDPDGEEIWAPIVIEYLHQRHISFRY
ncbi:MAG TPA: alpha/beta fold hydrolase [Candidatus Kapabacteria bacterium]